MNEVTAACRQCNASFTYHRTGKPRLYCSVECRRRCISERKPRPARVRTYSKRLPFGPGNCIKCGQPAESEFIANTGGKNKIHTCRACRAAYMREYEAARRITPPRGPALSKADVLARARDKFQKSGRFARYGITAEDFDRMWKSQRGRCGICAGVLSNERAHGGCKVNIDHDHRDGRVRGLLCSRCNSGIGLLRDDPRLLRRAAKWVKSLPLVHDAQ
jgi:hypothetical protein